MEKGCLEIHKKCCCGITLGSGNKKNLHSLTFCRYFSAFNDFLGSLYDRRISILPSKSLYQTSYVCSKYAPISGGVEGAGANHHKCLKTGRETGTSWGMSQMKISAFCWIKVNFMFETFFSTCLIRFLLKIGTLGAKGIRKKYEGLPLPLTHCL